MDNIELAAILSKLNKTQKEIDKLASHKYELIETITVSEEAVTVISRTQEPNGTAYDFQKMRIEACVKPASTTARVYMSVDDILVGSIATSLLTTSDGDKFSWAETEIQDGLVKSKYTAAVVKEKMNISSSTLYAIVNSLENLSKTSLNSVQIYASAAFPVGSEFKIYAVRSA